MPAGSLVTVPEPVPLRLSVNVKREVGLPSADNVAVILVPTTVILVMLTPLADPL